ncbi:DUF2306 domain-containing protein [Actinomadura sp. KC06]|nr:DUF2306 domain-containing protein [Actinomadura sp. KC06]
MIGLLVLVGFNLFHALPYAALDPARSRSILDPAFPAHFPVLVAHILTGNIAMVTVFLQVIPAIREQWPRLHRISGRVYVFAGALPSATLALVILPYSTATSGTALSAALWLVVTAFGWRAARQRRYADHRRLMIYSFALALGTSWGRVIFVLTTAMPSIKIPADILMDTSTWTSWVVNLIIAQWWLIHTEHRRRRKPRRVVATQ